MKITPFLINTSEAAISDLKLRLATTRWPDEIAGSGWDYGMPLAIVKPIVEYWRDRFDWKMAEHRLNAQPQFQLEIDGQKIHYLHVKGVDPGSLPIILTHGWPGSFVELYKIIPMLSDPANNGLPAFQSFDVIIPSLPGFGFSQAPIIPGTNTRVIASIWHKLMLELGYTNYFAQGGDIGAGVSSWLARLYPNSVRALHLNFVPGSFLPPFGSGERALSTGETEWLASRSKWIEKEGGYSHLQSTKPQTLAYSLVDSPVGLAAWMLEKFFSWSDGGPELTTRFDIDELLTNISVYWFSNNAASTLRIYKENADQPFSFAAGEKMSVPLCFAKFPKEILSPPREWVERAYNVRRWTEFPFGGHFAALEQPLALARDVHESFMEFR
jgi:pimeloyl-ACP methyl ester carboxylesterase